MSVTTAEREDLARFGSEMREKGWCVLPEHLDSAAVAELNRALESAAAICRATQIKNGLAANTDGTLHHLVALDPVFVHALESLALDAFLTNYFGGKYILNSYGGVINRRGAETYVMNPHRDVRSFVTDVHLMINVLVMLDDFTTANGATHVLSGSHRRGQTPERAVFFRESERVTGHAGDVLLFDSNLLHATGENRTDAPRRALTLTFTKPFMKQQLDYPRALGYDKREALSAHLVQVLGYNSRVPATLDEWYQPPEKRMYRRDQE